MDEQEPGEQFEATDYDEKGNIKLPPPQIAPPKKKRVTVAELNKAIDEIRDVQFPETFEWLGGIDIRLTQVEERTAKHNEALLSDVKTRLDILDTAVMGLSDALPILGKAIAELRQPPETELEFAQPPPQPAGGQTSKRDLEAVASVCNSTSDVLMICRALKAAQDLTDEDRKYILQVAGRASGVPLTGGIYIRAGMQYVEA
jgi:hypothetical protein